MALGSTGVERKLIFSHLDRQASSERSFLAIWIDRRRANAQAGKAGRSGRLGKPGRPSRRRKQDILGASCAEPSEARLRAADQEMLCFSIVRISKASEGQGELQSASLLSRCVRRCFVCIPLARFPFLLSQVFTFVVKPMKTKNHIFWHHQGSRRWPQMALGSTGVKRKLTFSYLDR